MLLMASICIYAYYEKNEEYKKNCQYFIDNGMNNASEYIFIVNGDSTINFPGNVKVIRRGNEGFDFGAWTDGLNSIDIDKYEYFIFINTSVIGPVSYKNEWQTKYINLIKGDTKLVGSSINIYCAREDCLLEESAEKFFKEKSLSRPFTHVQTPIFVMDKECLSFLKDKIFIHQEFKDIREVVLNREVLMSQYVLKNNWNISCLLKEYKGLDYRYLTSDINTHSIDGEAYFPGKYFGRSMDTNELIFVKTGRINTYTFNEIYIKIIFLSILIFFVFIIYVKYH
jgi:Rhamnan synthesis protein F